MQLNEMGQARITFTNARLDALTAADFETLAWLAETIWRAHYTKIIGSAQIDCMLAGRYTPDWCCRSGWSRILRLAGLVAGGVTVYFAVLAALGFRPRHFSRHAIH